MNFDFYNPVRMITGENCVVNNSAELKKLGKSCLIVTGSASAKKSGALGDVLAALEREGISHMIYDKVQPNPLLTGCVEAGQIAREHGLEFVIGIGGSPIDTAKAAAVFAANDMADPLQIYDMSWTNRALPIVAIGTTAGTGSEVACFSVLTKPDGRKKSFGNHETYPKLMFGDARYTRTLPLNFTISTALDALAHAVETYFSTIANDFTDLYAIEAVRVLAAELELLKSAKDAADVTSARRERLYYASVAAGVSLSQCGTLYCHTLSYFLTEDYGVPHGFACAATLPDLLRRAERAAPKKSARLCDEAKVTVDALCNLIESLRVLPEVRLSAAEIASIAKAGAATKNFERTPPSGFTEADAVELLTRMYG